MMYGKEPAEENFCHQVPSTHFFIFLCCISLNFPLLDFIAGRCWYENVSKVIRKRLLRFHMRVTWISLFF